MKMWPSCRHLPQNRLGGGSLSHVSDARSHALHSSKLNGLIRRHPVAFFGLPFLITMVGGSFLLATFTRTRYELHDSKNYQISKEEELHMRKDRRKIDIREEYFVCRLALAILCALSRTRNN
jgi:Cytochrome c oxidase assembly protein COX16